MSKSHPASYWTTRIRPRTGWFDINLKDLWHYRDLIWTLVRRDFTLIYKQTILGPAWVIIQPLLTTIIFTVIFGNIAGLPTDGMPKFLFYMGGNIAWQYFSNCLTTTSNTFISNRNLFGKVYFPRLCVPIATACSQLINFFVQFALFIGIVAYYALQPNPIVHPNWKLIAMLPLMLLQLAMLGLGFGIIVSSMTTKYRDLALLVSFGVHLWMYATPVAYPASMIAEKFPQLLGVYMLNPMTPLIELFRSAFLGTPCYYMNYYWLSIAMTVLVFLLGVVLFSKVEKTFMDTV
ncbi:MAG: ABC transporter permease [Clostridia bacterium]|nr:ABC transporter permease [Clostridia bacterium]